MVLEEAIVKYASALDGVEMREMEPSSEHGASQLVFYRGEKIFLVL